MLPHRYPFRFVREGGVVGDRLRVEISQGSPWLAHAPALGLALTLEILAQGSHVLLGAGEAVLLAGIEGAAMLSPVVAGDRLTLWARPAGAFGPVARVEAVLRRHEAEVARATLLLVQGPEEPKAG